MTKNRNVKYVILRYTYDTTGKIISGFVFFVIIVFELSGTDSDLAFSINKILKSGTILSISAGLLLILACYFTGSVLQLLGRSKRTEYKVLQELYNRYSKSENKIKGKVLPFSYIFSKMNVMLPVIHNSRAVIQKLDEERNKMLTRLEIIESISKDVSLNISKLKTEILIASAVKSGMLTIFLFMTATHFSDWGVFPVLHYSKFIAPLIIFLLAQLMVKKLWYSYYSDISGTYLLFQLQAAYDKNNQ